MPLFPYKVLADTITSANIIGVNRTLVNTSLIESHTVNISPLGDVVIARYSYEYELTVQLDDYYLGYINGSFSTSLNDVQYSDGSIYNRTATKNNSSYYVNGNSFTTSFSTIACFRVIQGSNNDPTGTYNTTFTLNTSNITKYQDLNSIDTVVDILNDINQYISIDVLDELHNIVSNTSLSNSYLELISELRQFNVPVESYSIVFPILYNGFELYSNYYYYSDYLIFEPDTTKYLLKTFMGSGRYYDFIIGFYGDNSYLANGSYINRLIDLSDSRISYEIINSSVRASAINIRFWHIRITPNESFNFELKLLRNDYKFIPVLYKASNLNTQYSTDFAIIWGLSNQLLDDIHIIAQGTQQSNQSGDDLENSAADITTNSNTMFQFENQQNTNMNNALQSINTNFDIGTIGSSFLTSAAWVKTQFDNLTNTTPFGSVLSFSLLLGLALLIIGKVYK